MDKSGNYRLRQDAVFEIYFYASDTCNFNIVFDMWLERASSKHGEPALTKLLGWHFTQLQCLQAVRDMLIAQGAAGRQSNGLQLLKGSQRLMMNPNKVRFVPSNEQLVVRVDSE